MIGTATMIGIATTIAAVAIGIAIGTGMSATATTIAGAAMIGIGAALVDHAVRGMRANGSRNRETR